MPLHSTMYLLILAGKASGAARRRTLHSTMYLLISNFFAIKLTVPSDFTFHYVSINILSHSKVSSSTSDFTFHYVSINILEPDTIMLDYCMLYIPLCIY